MKAQYESINKVGWLRWQGMEFEKYEPVPENVAETIQAKKWDTLVWGLQFSDLTWSMSFRSASLAKDPLLATFKDVIIFSAFSPFMTGYHDRNKFLSDGTADVALAQRKRWNLFVPRSCTEPKKEIELSHEYWVEPWLFAESDCVIRCLSRVPEALAHCLWVEFVSLL